MEFHIRKARPEENKILTEISLAAKRYWNYPEEYYAVWEKELTITAAYIEKNQVFVAETKDNILGYCSITEVKKDFYAGKVLVKKGFWLEHIFVSNRFFQKGIRKRFIQSAEDYGRENKIP